MQKKVDEILMELNGLVNEGHRMIYDYNPERILKKNIVNSVVELYSDYMKWNYTCCPLLNQNGFSKEMLEFNEINDFGLRTGQTIFNDNEPTFEKSEQYLYKSPYSDATRKEAPKLLNNMLKNISFRIEILNQVRDELLHRTQKQGVADQKALWVDYPKDRMIMINNKYRLHRPRFNSTNDKFFSYLMDHQNQMVQKIELRMDKESWSIHQCLRDLGFVNELQRAFFPEVSNSFIFFRNPVNQKDLKPFKELMDKILKVLEKNSNEIVGTNRNT
jgi:hypothetical protein